MKKIANIFLLPAFVLRVIACCVTHFIVQIIIVQRVEECDATMFNFYSSAWFIIQKNNSMF